MRRLSMFLFCWIIGIGLLHAQNRTVTGIVTDASGTPVSNASVLVKNTQIGTTTNEQGQFSLSVPLNGQTLVITYVGFTLMEVGIGSDNTVNVALSPQEASLTEVVVVGYTVTTKEAFTGSAKVVSAERITNKNVSNVSQALAGEVAGVRIINTSGQPGTSATIRIRGIGSVNGNRSPLYVVDGVPYSGTINSINPADIANITVLKDAAATSIYGSRGANGVIVITTRSGKSKKSFIEIDGKYGTNSSLLPRYSVIKSPEEFIGLSWEAMYNQAVANGAANAVDDANTKLFSPDGISVNNNIWNVANGGQLIDPVTRMVKTGVTRKFDPENWEDFAFQPSSRTEANLRMGGGEGRTNYYTSFGYLKDEGYVINSNFERISARINLNHEVKSWLTTAFNVNYANSTTNNNGQEANSNSVFWFADNIPSIYPLFLRNAAGNKIEDPIFGGFKYDYGANGRGFGPLTNAIADATYNTNRTKRNDVTGNASVNVKFTNNLSLENRIGVQYFNEAGVNRNNKFYGSAASQNGSIGQTKMELLNINFLNMLRYAKKFNAHNLEVLAAHESTNYRQSQSNASGYNLVDNNSLELNNAIVFNPASSYVNTNKLESYFGQANYDYESIYYLSATARRDGSSRFIKGNKWGTFGSVGLGWVVTKMKFMEKQPLFDYLKVKASYGVLGDQEGLGYYPGYDRYDISNLNDNPSFAFNTKGNPDLTWETSKMFQTGIDFGIGKYLTGTIDYYIKNTDNLIFDRRTAPSLGYAIIQVNDGKLQNKGLEFELVGHVLKNKNYHFDLSVNGEHFTNKITAMPIEPTTGKQKPIDVQAPFGWAVGHSIFDFYIRNFAGVDPQTGTSTWTVYYDDANANKSFDPGEQVSNLEDYYSKNPAKKGTLLTGITKTYSQATQYYIGKSALPKLRGAFNLNGGWKAIDVSIQFLYSLGGYAYDYAYAALMDNGDIGGNNWSTDIRNRWQKAGDITDVPRISNNQDANVSSSSSRFITRADYISLNNIRVSYTLPANVITHLGFIDQASFYISGDNLWLKSKRNGFNPSTAESGESDTYRYSPLSTISFGFKAKF